MEWNEKYETMLKDIRNSMQIAKDLNDIELYQSLEKIFNQILEVSRLRYGEHIELWKDIEGFEYYQVSTKGRIRSFIKGKEPKILKPYDNGYGYLYINLYKNNKMYAKRVHKLVAEAFIPNPEGKTEVNHINGNKTDNRLINLEWTSPSENKKHAYETGLRFSNDILDRPCIRLNNGAIYPSINLASQVFDINPKTIWENCNEKIDYCEANGTKYYFDFAIIVNDIETKIKNPFNLASERV